MLPQQCVCWPDFVGYVFLGYSRYTLVEVGMQRIASPSASVFCYSVPSCRDEGDYTALLMLIIQSVLMRVLQRRHPVFSSAMMAHTLSQAEISPTL